MSNPAGAVPAAGSHEANIQLRFERQQQRIDQGVESGQLTAGEYDKLQQHLDKIEGEFAHDESQNGGNLTAKEQHSLERQLDNSSNNIYFDKHNLAKQPGAPDPTGSQGAPVPPSDGTHPRVSQIDARFERQQDRIDQGVASGQLTQREYDHLENHLHGEEAEAKRDEAQHDGHLTLAEQTKLNRQLDNSSDQIYFDKHNLARQPGAPQA